MNLTRELVDRIRAIASTAPYLAVKVDETDTTDVSICRFDTEAALREFAANCSTDVLLMKMTVNLEHLPARQA